MWALFSRFIGEPDEADMVETFNTDSKQSTL